MLDVANAGHHNRVGRRTCELCLMGIGEAGSWRREQGQGGRGRDWRAPEQATGMGTGGLWQVRLMRE